MRLNFPKALAVIFIIFWTILAISPVSREVWWAENIPIMAVFAFLAATYRRFRFSNLSYALMAFWLFWHTVGGHYTFAGVPFGWFSDLFGFERNHFDRIGHFSVGFYAYPLAEFLWRKRLAHPAVIFLFGLFAIMSVACAYELIEWQYAVIEGGDAGVEFLGSQGDVWDAQKDMFADTLGALFALGIFALRKNSLPQGACGQASLVLGAEKA
jgi:putative membrane protein